MGIVSAVLRERGERYANARGLTLQPDEQFHVGSGQDGSVLATSRNTAAKVFKYEQLHERERDVYVRLQINEVKEIQSCNVRQIVDSDDSLWVVEMTIVSRPFVLDFAGAHLDIPPNYPAELVEEWDREKEELFEDQWPQVRAIRASLRRYGIYLTDLTPNNIALVP